SPCVLHSSTGTGAGVVDRPALVRRAQRDNEVGQDAIAHLSDQPDSDVASDARRLVGDLGAQHDRPPVEGLPVELGDPAQADSAEDFSSEHQVGPEVAADADEGAAPAADTALAQTDDRS